MIRSALLWNFLLIFAQSVSLYGVVEFQHIKNRQVAQFELTEIILDLSSRDSLYLLDRWIELSPKSFKNIDFTKAYLLAADRNLERKDTNNALIFYIKSYQSLDKNYSDKITAAYKVSLLLYAQKKRPEALFYINRAIAQLKKNTHPFRSQIKSLKRRIVWRYFSRLEYLPDNAISAVSFDGDDVWIGMWSGGVARFSRSGARLDLFNARNTAIPSNYIRDILIQPTKVWVTTDRGLAFYDKATGKWTQIPFFNGFKLKRLIFDGTYIYVATLFKGVYRSIDGVSWENIVSRHSVLDLKKIDDELYIGTPENGIYRYHNSVIEEFLPKISAKTIISDINPKFLWIGTYGQGLLKVNRSNGKIVQTFTKAELGSDYIESLLLVDQTLWIGTLESGVIVYDLKSKDWESIALKEGLPGMDITTITQENEFIWFGTLAGGIGIYLFQDKEG
ncbi:MAG: hypothetical protein ACRCTJ_05955 [Brevinema sp.]